jgi:glutamine synthetase
VSAGVSARFAALSEASSRHVRRVPPPADETGAPLPISKLFGTNTFNQVAMEKYLPTDVFQKLQATIRNGSRLDMAIADSVAHGMREWAMARGATHFCHWFQPQTGLSAEKHDAFLSFDSAGKPIERFSGSQLIQSEPDASSFPSGGMRSTFEARGYTAWDPSSPAFLMEGPNGKTLCIPSAFIGYHGEALDQKAPLLRSMEALSRRALDLLRLLGNKSATRVVPTAGPEQEYFLVDLALHTLRPDLILAGRSLVGAKPPKGQELEDHYFGSIKPRIQAFMQESEYELYRLGIPAKTRHNEVAPSQYEIAPIFEEANVASDHNQLLMEVLRVVARRHDLVLLLHEKPFAGINGSGKHVNWSMADSDGNNLLEPGSTPQANLQFLVFLMSVLKGVHRRAGLIRSSVASAGNDHRLGANEAPPAIMSVFLGEQLDRILDSIEKGTKGSESTEKRILSLGISSLPAVSRDNTDRNRTSPFAFTGNKFEFRAVGSAFAISTPIAFLNAAVAEGLDDMTRAIREKLKDGAPIDRAVIEVVKAAVTETRAVRFEGNNYAPEWVVEAEKRKLPHRKTTPEALEFMNRPDEKQFLERLGVLSPAEAESRYHVKLERYIKDLEIEVQTLEDMVRTMVLPAAYRFQAELAGAVTGLAGLTGGTKKGGHAAAHVQKAAAELAELTGQVSERMESLDEAVGKAEGIAALDRRAHYYASQVAPALAAVRAAADRLEEIVPDDLWPLPKYRELLFVG